MCVKLLLKIQLIQLVGISVAIFTKLNLLIKNYDKHTHLLLNLQYGLWHKIGYRA